MALAAIWTRRASTTSELAKADSLPPVFNDIAGYYRGELTGMAKVNTFTFVSATPAGVPQDRARRSRLRIIEAAKALFAKTSFDATTIKDIAEAAELSVGLVCRYFPTREHIALALYERLAEELATLAVDLPTGSTAKRFEALMRARIAQCDAERRPLTALLGKALDPEATLYALGPSTEMTRAKVQSALRVVLACSSDPPASETELARQAQLLYTIQLGVVLATLARPDTELAVALVGQLGRALRVARLPLVRGLVHQQLAALMLDRPRGQAAKDERAVCQVARSRSARSAMASYFSRFFRRVPSQAAMWEKVIFDGW